MEHKKLNFVIDLFVLNKGQTLLIVDENLINLQIESDSYMGKFDQLSLKF